MRARLSKKCINKWIRKYEELHKKYSKVREEAAALEAGLVQGHKEYATVLDENKQLANKVIELAYEKKMLQDEINELTSKKWWKRWGK